MNNLKYLLAAWIVVWAVFSFYQVSISRRMSQLRKDVDRLNQERC